MKALFGLFRFDERSVDEDVRGAKSACARRFSRLSVTRVAEHVALGYVQTGPGEWITQKQVPRQSRCGHVQMVASARLDNTSDLRRVIRAPDDNTAFPDDDSLVLSAFEKWGRGCCEKLLGDWSFAAWDSSCQTLSLARDHFGHCGLYCYQDSQRFVFSSSLHAVLSVPGVPCEPDHRSIASLVRGSSRGNRTSYAGVCRLEPARRLTISASGTREEQYWNPCDAPDVGAGSDEEYAEAFREIYASAVRSRICSSSRVGVTLSGGLDSGSVAALAAEQLNAENRSITGIAAVPAFDGSAADSEFQFGDERPWIEMLRRHCRGLDVRYVTSLNISPVAGIRRVLEYCGHPFVASANSYWLCGVLEEAAQCGIKTLLTGHGGNLTVSWTGNRDAYLSSLLRSGNIRQYIAEVRAWKRVNNASSSRTLINQVLRSLTPQPWLRRWKRYRATAMESFLHPDFLSQHREIPNHSESASDNSRQPHLSSAKRKFSAMMRTDGNAAWQELGSAFGIQVSAPPLDVRVIEFCLGVPEEQFTRNGQRKLLIRRAMRNRMPEKLLWNDRKGRQSSDLITRIRIHREEIGDVLSGLSHSPSCATILNLPVMQGIFEHAQTDTNPLLFRRAANILLGGLMTGLFLQQFESQPASHVSSAA